MGAARGRVSGRTGPLRVDVVGGAGLCPAGPGIDRRVLRVGDRAPEPPADLVLVDLDAAGGKGFEAIRRSVDPGTDVVVLAVSRDAASARPALAAGASDFALLPRDSAWLAATVDRERVRRRAFDRGRRLVVDVPPTGLPFEEYEARIVQHALDRAGWNRSRAARELAISRPRLLRMIDRHGLVPPSGASSP
jgi:DNA-binding NtrC family response regulator